jgi:replicative DNA helicase
LDGLREEIDICTKNVNKNSALYFLNTVFYKAVDKYVSYQKKRTGFELLDKNLDGLMPALYLLGAGSSLGKTTFMLQMADNIARNGNDVLYFSLEQSKFELISKSLSRFAWVEFNEKVTAKQVMYNIDMELTSQCIDLYKSTAERLFIYEGNFNTTVKEIENKINGHISLTGNKPVVIIDYLQVIQGENVAMSDKSIIDNMVTTLKRISRNLFIPIFVISSLNRANYQNPISYESFKESGSIEYTADVLLGLQYSIVNEIQSLGEKKITQKRIEMKKAIDGDKEDNYRRDIELVALKNRSGKQRFSVKFSFYPGLNYFEEKESQEEEQKLLFVF